MTSIGMVVSILAIGLLIYFLLRSGNCGESGQQDCRHNPAEPGQKGRRDPEIKKRHKGGCCG